MTDEQKEKIIADVFEKFPKLKEAYDGDSSKDLTKEEATEMYLYILSKCIPTELLIETANEMMKEEFERDLRGNPKRQAYRDSLPSRLDESIAEELIRIVTNKENEDESEEK